MFLLFQYPKWLLLVGDKYFIYWRIKPAKLSKLCLLCQENTSDWIDCGAAASLQETAFVIHQLYDETVKNNNMNT